MMRIEGRDFCCIVVGPFEAEFAVLQRDLVLSVCCYG